MIKRILLLVVLGILIVVGLSVGSMYWAVTSAQPHYIQALEQPPEVLQESSRQLENRFTTLTSDLQSQGQWQTVVSADEVNGWLAYKLPESFPDLLPQEVQDPRVVFTTDHMILAAQSEVGSIDTVVSVYIVPFVTDEGDLAIELRQVLAGALPVPTKEIIDRLVYATRRARLPIRWTQSNGQPVMIVEHELWDTEKSQQRVLEAVELADGEFFLSGRTEATAAEPDEAQGVDVGEDSSDRP